MGKQRQGMGNGEREFVGDRGERERERKREREREQEKTIYMT